MGSVKTIGVGRSGPVLGYLSADDLGEKFRESIALFNGQKFFECHVLPRNWQLLADFMKKLEQQVFQVKNPNWHEAPITGMEGRIIAS